MKTTNRALLFLLLGLLLCTWSGEPANDLAAQSVVQTIRTATVDTRDAHMTHANFIRVRDTTEEFILDFGTNDQAPAAPDRAIRIDERVVLSTFTAKRLLLALEVTVGNHERTFGKIEIEPTKRVKP